MMYVNLFGYQITSEHLRSYSPIGHAPSILVHLFERRPSSKLEGAYLMAASAHANMQDAEKSALYAALAIAMDPEDPMLLYNVACLYSVLGRTEDCLTALEQAVNKGWGDKAWLEHDSDFDAVRQELRYLALVRAM